MWKLWFFLRSWIMSKRINICSIFFSPSGSYTILVYRSYIDTKHRAASLRQQSFLFWYARALAVRNTSRGVAEWRISYNQRDSVYIYIYIYIYQKHVLHGQETVSIFIANLRAISNDILRKKHGTLLYCGRSAALRQWASLSMGRVLKFSQTDGIDSVWCISILSDFLSYYAWTLMSYWLLFTFLLNVHCHGNHL